MFTSCLLVSASVLPGWKSSFLVRGGRTADSGLVRAAWPSSIPGKRILLPDHRLALVERQLPADAGNEAGTSALTEVDINSDRSINMTTMDQ